MAFDAMDTFLEWVLVAINEHGARAVRVFPPASHVLLAFADRVASDVVSNQFASVPSLSDFKCRSANMFHHYYLEPENSQPTRISSPSLRRSGRVGGWSTRSSLRRRRGPIRMCPRRRRKMSCLSALFPSEVLAYRGVGIECSKRIWTSTLTKKWRLSRCSSIPYARDGTIQKYVPLIETISRSDIVQRTRRALRNKMQQGSSRPIIPRKSSEMS